MNANNLVPSDSEFAAIEGLILHRAQKADLTRRRRNLAFGATVAPMVLLGITGAAIFASAELRENSAYCYESADLGSRSTQVGTATDVRDAQGKPVASAVADAVNMCAAVWRIGFFESSSPPADDGITHEVPELQMCVRSDGIAAVLPVEDLTASDDTFCSELGLALP